MKSDVFGVTYGEVLQFAVDHSCDHDDEDWWLQMNDKVDLNFWTDDYPESPSYQQLKVTAYRVFVDENGDFGTDMNDFIRII